MPGLSRWRGRAEGAEPSRRATPVGEREAAVPRRTESQSAERRCRQRWRTHAHVACGRRCPWNARLGGEPSEAPGSVRQRWETVPAEPSAGQTSRAHPGLARPYEPYADLRTPRRVAVTGISPAGITVSARNRRPSASWSATKSLLYMSPLTRRRSRIRSRLSAVILAGAERGGSPVHHSDSAPYRLTPPTCPSSDSRRRPWRW